jgi:hypothetical protein
LPWQSSSPACSFDRDSPPENAIIVAANSSDASKLPPRRGRVERVRGNDRVAKRGEIIGVRKPDTGD